MSIYFNEITFNIALQGNFNLLQIRQVLENYRYIAQRWFKRNDVFIYSLETDTGIAEVNVFALKGYQPGYTDTILFKVPLSTPPEFMSDVIELISKLADIFVFFLEVYEFRMDDELLLYGWSKVDHYTKLIQGYEEIHDLWRSATGMPACKTTELLLSQNCIMAQVKQKQRAVSIILCPRGSEIHFAQFMGYPDYGIEGDLAVDRTDFYRQVESIELKQCRLMGIRDMIKTSGPIPQDSEQEIITKCIRVEVNGVEHNLEIHRYGSEQVHWVEYQLTFGTTRHVLERILQCLIELAIALAWQIIEGVDFHRFDPLKLDTQKLTEFITVPPQE